MAGSEIPNTWATRERPILKAILAIEEADGDRLLTDQLAEAAGISEPDARRGLLALIEDGYVSTGQRLGGHRGPMIVLGPRLRGKGRRAVGQWPADGFDALVALLDERIRAEPDQAARSRLVRLRDAVVGIGREVLTDVLAKVVTGGLGL